MEIYAYICSRIAIMKLSIGMIASSLLAIACGTKTKVCEAVLTAPLDDNS